MNFLRRCSPADLDMLRELSIRTFYHTFAAQCAPADMQAYLAQAFAEENLLAQLRDRNSEFYFLFADDILTGYLKLNEAPSQSDLHDEAALEIERIYVCAEYQGQGFGKYLLEQAVQKASERSKNYVWLGVWEKNEKALRFYRLNGFYQIGRHDFVMGEDAQSDFIMRKDLL